MGRIQSFQGGSKAITASTTQTIIFTPQDLESAGLVKLLFSFGGSTVATNAIINRIRLRAGPDLLFDCTFTQLQALQQAYSKRMVADLSANSYFSIPLHMLDAPTEEAQDLSQFPPGRDLQVEIDVTSGAGAGQVIYAGWVLSDVAPQYYPRYYSQALNFAASSNNQRYPIVEAGMVRGIALPTANWSRAELFISGKSAFRAPGPLYGGATTAGDMLVAKDYFDNGITVTSQKLHKVSLNSPAAPGNSYLLMDTGAGWATTDAMTLHSIVPLNARG